MESAVWGHRGAAALKPENGLAGFREAIRCGATGVELDLQMTADGNLIVLHDEELGRLTGHTGFVGDLTLEEVRELGRFVGDGTTESFAPLLAEVYDLLAPTDLTINVELKTSVRSYPGLVTAAWNITEQKGLSDRVVFSSFNHRSLAEMRRYSCRARLGLLVSDVHLDLPATASALKAEALHIPVWQTRMASLMESYRTAGMALRVWTVNSSDDALRLAGRVDALITDDPAATLAILGRRSPIVG